MAFSIGIYERTGKTVRPDDIQRLRIEAISDALLHWCHAPDPTEDWWPTCPCCGRQASLLKPLEALPV